MLISTYTPNIVLTPKEKAYKAIYNNVKLKHPYYDDKLCKSIAKSITDRRTHG